MNDVIGQEAREEDGNYHFSAGKMDSVCFRRSLTKKNHRTRGAPRFCPLWAFDCVLLTLSVRLASITVCYSVITSLSFQISHNAPRFG